MACFREMTAGPKAASFLHLAQKRGRAAIAPRPALWRILLFFARHFRGQ